PSHYFSSFCLLILPPPPHSSLFPYTTLFRSPTSVFNISARLGPSQSSEGSPEVLRKGRIASETAGAAGPGLATGPKIFPRKTTTDRKSTRLNSSHVKISYAVFCLKKKKKKKN